MIETKKLTAIETVRAAAYFDRSPRGMAAHKAQWEAYLAEVRAEDQPKLVCACDICRSATDQPTVHS